MKQDLGNYQNHSADLHVGVEFDVSDVDTTAALAQLEDFESQLQDHVKVAVLAALGVDGEYTQGGTLLPVLKPPAPKTQTNFEKPKGGGGSKFGAPKADVTQQPVVEFTLGDFGPEKFYDLRSLKEAGVYKPTAADFQKVGGTFKVWIKDQSGNVRQDVAAALSAAGITI